MLISGTKEFAVAISSDAHSSLESGIEIYLSSLKITDVLRHKY